jgi:mono/diheme cytochrome c family protein
MHRSPAPLFRLMPLAIAILLAVPTVAQVVTPPPIPDQPPGAQTKGDAARGKVIADRWCAECHVVSPQQTSGKADVPPFSAIAAKGLKDTDLQRFLMNPHPRMPDMQIGRAEAADLVAYIDAQKR